MDERLGVRCKEWRENVNSAFVELMGGKVLSGTHSKKMTGGEARGWESEIESDETQQSGRSGKRDASISFSFLKFDRLRCQPPPSLQYLPWECLYLHL